MHTHNLTIPIGYKAKSLVKAALMTSGQETGWAYSTPPDPHGGLKWLRLIVSKTVQLLDLC